MQSIETNCYNLVKNKTKFKYELYLKSITVLFNAWYIIIDYNKRLLNKKKPWFNFVNNKH